MQSHSDLIPRAEALRRIRELHAGIYRANCTPMTAAVGNMLGVVYSDIAAIPAIGTCATCEHWHSPYLKPHQTWGYCSAQVYDGEIAYASKNYGHKPIVPPDHYCAAYRRRDA
jgi:hypothetical protein